MREECIDCKVCLVLCHVLLCLSVNSSFLILTISCHIIVADTLHWWLVSPPKLTGCSSRSGRHRKDGKTFCARNWLLSVCRLYCDLCSVRKLLVCYYFLVTDYWFGYFKLNLIWVCTVIPHQWTVKWRTSRLVSDSVLPRLHHWSSAALDYPPLGTKPFRLLLFARNSLLQHVTSAPLLLVFRSRLKTHLFTISYPSPWLCTVLAQ